MKIENIFAAPNEELIPPSIQFIVEISHKVFQEAIIGVSGWLQTDDGKFIATLNEYLFLKPRINEIAARGSSFDNKFKDVIYGTVLIANLSKNALEHIEKRRMLDRKNDVKIKLIINVKYIESKAIVSESFLLDPEDIGLPKIDINTASGLRKGNIIVYAYDPKYSTDINNRWIISGRGDPIFLAMAKRTLEKELIISSSDWIHDYSPKLELGEFFIVEIPKGEEKIKEAWDYIEKAKECYMNWDTKGVYANCRECGSLLDRTIKSKYGKSSFIYKEKWERTYKRFNDFASLDLHIEDIKRSPEYFSEDVKVEKADVEHTLLVTKMLIKYAKELLKE